MSNSSSCYSIAEFIRNIFDVPKYYVFEGNSDYYDVDNLYSIVNDINIFIIGNSEFNPNCKINDIVRICEETIRKQATSVTAEKGGSKSKLKSSLMQ